MRECPQWYHCPGERRFGAGARVRDRLEGDLSPRWNRPVISSITVCWEDINGITEVSWGQQRFSKETSEKIEGDRFRLDLQIASRGIGEHTRLACNCPASSPDCFRDEAGDIAAVVFAMGMTL